MKKALVIIIALFLGNNGFSQGIEFEHGSFADALAKAKKENKLVFMDCYTTWCGPCKYLAKNVFTQKKVGEFFNKNFINVKMDMESEAGKPLLKKYQVSAFPTLLWLDADGNIQHKTVGAGDAKSLIGSASTALDPENNWGALDKRFKNGDRNIEFLQKYILTSSKAYIETKEAIEIYFSNRKPEQLINAKDVEIIAATVKSTADPNYHFVLKNKEKFYAVAEKPVIDKFLERTMLIELTQLARKGDIESFESKKKELTELDEKIGEKVIAQTEMWMLQRDPDRKKFYNALADYTLKYEFDNSKNLNQYAWKIVEAKEDLGKEILNKALKMAKRSVDLDTNFANTDTYAYILYKLGQKKEAREFASKSVELATDEQKTDLWSAQYLDGEAMK